MAGQTETGDSGTAPARRTWLPRPRKDAWRIMGMLLLVTAALAVVGVIAYGILVSRTTYFEQRNLRELDRIAAELSSTGEGLAQAATLHFVPQQLHFSLSRQVECLVATTEVMGAQQQPMTITYYFTDPDSTRRIAEWYAAQTPRSPPSSAAAPRLDSESLPEHICRYQRPLGLPLDQNTRLEDGAIELERTVRLANLIWPMASDRSVTRGDLARCSGQPLAAGEPLPRDYRGFIQDCLLAAATDDLRDQSFSFRERGEIPRIAEESIEAAFRSNTVRINVSTPASVLDFEPALEIFDAIQIIGSDGDNRPVLLHQAGRVPPTSEGDEPDETRMMDADPASPPSVVAGISGSSSPQRRAAAARDGSFLTGTRVLRSGNLIIFQQTHRRLAGLNCNPCRIVGIVERGKFNRTVRKFDGVQATVFLIGLATLFGLVPLLQLILRKRLDASSRPGQYVMWFSLTLLAANASIAALALWSSTASRNNGVTNANSAAAEIESDFRRELAQSLELIERIGSQLGPSDSIFPAPATYPTIDQLDDDSRTLSATTGIAALTTLASAMSNDRHAAIVDTVQTFRSDGFVDRDQTRIAMARFPAFGTSLAGRHYFLRARNRDFHGTELRPACEGRPETFFLMDRVFARPDGAPRTVWVMPRPPQADLSVQPAAARDNLIRAMVPPARCWGIARRARHELGPGYKEDSLTHDPTHAGFLVASGTLRTFFGRTLQPGFSYTILDPGRPDDQPNVLFHSRRNAELVERFQQEIDDPQRFETIVRETLGGRDAGSPDNAGSRESGAENYRQSDIPRLRMDTKYRAQPARLSISRLHPEMDWLLVIIEDRDDAGFAVWRAATFGYAIWIIAALAVGAVLAVGRVRRPGSLDRRPGLWLWPRKRLGRFTPPRIARHAAIKLSLEQAAVRRDRHIWWVMAAGLIGVPAAEGASRILFALAAVFAALTARAYFRGLTAGDDDSACRNDRGLILATLLLLLLAAIIFAFALHADHAYRQATEGASQALARAFWLRFAGFSLAGLIVGRCLLAASAYSRCPAAGDNVPAGRFHDLRRRLESWNSRVQRTDIGWMIALALMGGLPAAAGFLDSYDQDRFLRGERAHQLQGEAFTERREAIRAINLARLAKLPEGLIDTIVRASPTSAAPAAERPVSAVDNCWSLSCRALYYLDLHDQALEHSDFGAFHMRHAVSRNRSWWTPVILALLVAVPFAALAAAFLVFRQQYFRAPPLLSPGKDPQFDPPLSLTRSELITEALLPAATKAALNLPFAPAGGNHHLILGVGLDLRDDPLPGGVGRVGDLAGVAWIDLLDPPRYLGITEAAVVIGNLDLALQVQDDPDAVRRTYRIISQITGLAGSGRRDERHVFLLADIDPLDRIAMLWERQGRTQAISLVEEWRWAELIQDFTLFPIRRETPVEVVPGEARMLRAIREELGVLDTRFAHQLRDHLLARMLGAPRDAAHADDYAEVDRIISFITEQMSDYYHQLWASSSDEERVMLFRVACDCHLKMRDSRALRSLLARGLLIRVPEYRLMNKSFARYVCRVGAASQIRSSAESLGGVDRVWPLIRYPLAAIAGASVLMLQSVAPSAPSGAVGALPALLALIPALLGKWLQDRAGAT